MAVQDYKINYKSDFVLNINGDAGWAVPFCIKFWTGMPSQAYFVGFDGVKYVNCRVGDTPTQLLVMFDDHHLPIGKLMMQIAYHTTIEEFPGSVFDEVTNARDVIVTIDGTDYQVMLDFTGEDAPELEFDLPAYANEAERIQNELQRQQNEADRIAAELQREQASAAAVQGAENVNAQLAGNILTVTNRQGVSTSVNTKGEQGEQGPVGPEGPQGQKGVSITGLVKTGETDTDTLYNVTFSDGTTQAVAIPKGEKGDRGPVGPQGQQGQTGVSITGLVKTGETETATLYNITFSNGTTQQVAIPKGEKGDQGEQGPEGPQGPMGDVAVITPEQQAAFTMYSVPGQNTNGPMTQKAVTDALGNIAASGVSYDNSQSGLAAENVQGAVDELSEGVSVKPSLIFDDSNHIFNIVDRNGNILAYWDSNGNLVFKKEIDIIEWHYNTPSLSPSTDEKGGYFTSSGVISYIGINANDLYFGWGKADVEEYRGKTIYIRNKVVASAYNLFVDEQGSVLEAWQQNGTIAKVVPNTAKYILLSNNFYSASGADATVNPAAYFVDGFKFLVDYFKSISFDKISIKAQDDDSENILNIADKSGNILAYFDKNGEFHANIANIDQDEFKMYLPDTINSYVGDTLQLFKYPMTLLGDYSNYGINLSVNTSNNNIRKYGKDLRRYFEFIPLATGTYNIDANVLNTRQMTVLVEKAMTINVLTPTNPSSVKNILCIGDSETEGVINNSGVTAADGSTTSTRFSWVNEIKARMTTSRTATQTLPAGLGLSNIHFIGTRNTTNGRHEGYGGWDGADFMKSGSPFYINGAVDFNAYLAKDNVYDDTAHKGVDIIYITLGANTTKTLTVSGRKLILSATEHKTQIISMLNAINTQLRTDSSKAYYNPNLKVVLLNYVFSWIDGYGYHPYGSGRYNDNCWTSQGYIACFNANNEIAAMDEYKNWVDSVLIAPQVDSEYAYCYINKQKNVYMAETEVNHLEAVHPNELGYRMFGAAVMRDLLGRI